MKKIFFITIFILSSLSVFASVKDVETIIKSNIGQDLLSNKYVIEYQKIEKEILNLPKNQQIEINTDILIENFKILFPRVDFKEWQLEEFYGSKRIIIFPVKSVPSSLLIHISFAK